jgi:hypothetical protein
MENDEFKVKPHKNIYFTIHSIEPMVPEKGPFLSLIASITNFMLEYTNKFKFRKQEILYDKTIFVFECENEEDFNKFPINDYLITYNKIENKYEFTEYKESGKIFTEEVIRVINDPKNNLIFKEDYGKKRKSIKSKTKKRKSIKSKTKKRRSVKKKK